MATEIRDAGGGLIGYQLSHTAQQVDDGLDAVATKAAQTDLAAEAAARAAADEALQDAINDLIGSAIFLDSEGHLYIIEDEEE